MFAFNTHLVGLISYILVLVLEETAKKQTKTKPTPKKPPTPFHPSQAIHDSVATTVPGWRMLAYLVVPYKAAFEQHHCSSADNLWIHYIVLEMWGPELYKLFSIVGKL